MTTTTTTITHEGTQITASEASWRALGFQLLLDGNSDRLMLGAGPHGIEALLYFGIQQAGTRDERAVIAAIVERDRRAEERTKATAQARLAESLGALAREFHAETAEQLVARLPDKIRPYVAKIMQQR